MRVAGKFTPGSVDRLDQVVAVVREDAGGGGRDFLDASAERIILERNSIDR
jgi:hypothetical protein